jgi:hypothetical protein
MYAAFRSEEKERNRAELSSSRKSRRDPVCSSESVFVPRIGSSFQKRNHPTIRKACPDRFAQNSPGQVFPTAPPSPCLETAFHLLEALFPKNIKVTLEA